MLIARSQRPDPRLLQSENSSTTLPARLIDVGLDSTQSPRLVNTAGQTGFYVALSHIWGSSEKKLTKSNMNIYERGIESSDIPRCALDAIELTRKLGVRYIWIDSLCVVRDDQEESLNVMLKMSDIYRSAILTICPSGTYDKNINSCIDSSILKQPFSIFLDWSRPTVAKSCSARLFVPNALSRCWIIQESSMSDLVLSSASLEEVDIVAGILVDRTQGNESDTLREGIPDSDRVHDAEIVKPEVDTNGMKIDEASREIVQGVHYVEAGKGFEALASFMKARELVSAFQLLTARSWKIHAVASANIALVYQMQDLLAMALDITETSLAVQSRLPNVDCNSSLE